MNEEEVIEKFLQRTKQYLTNDESREYAIKQAIEKERNRILKEIRVASFLERHHFEEVADIVLDE